MIEEIERMVRDVIKTFGGLDIVIGNAVSFLFLFHHFLLSRIACTTS